MNQNENNEIEQLAKSLYQSFSLMSDPVWDNRDTPFHRKCRNKAESMIKEGYRKNQPESSGLVPLYDKEKCACCGRPLDEQFKKTDIKVPISKVV